jgi:hypothetical protein
VLKPNFQKNDPNILGSNTGMLGFKSLYSVVKLNMHYHCKFVFE